MLQTPKEDQGGSAQGSIPFGALPAGTAAGALLGAFAGFRTESWWDVHAWGQLEKLGYLALALALVVGGGLLGALSAGLLFRLQRRYRHVFTRRGSPCAPTPAGWLGRAITGCVLGLTPGTALAIWASQEFDRFWLPGAFAASTIVAIAAGVLLLLAAPPSWVADKLERFTGRSPRPKTAQEGESIQRLSELPAHRVALRGLLALLSASPILTCTYGLALLWGIRESHTRSWRYFLPTVVACAVWAAMAVVIEIAVSRVRPTRRIWTAIACSFAACLPVLAAAAWVQILWRGQPPIAAWSALQDTLWSLFTGRDGAALVAAFAISLIALVGVRQGLLPYWGSRGRRWPLPAQLPAVATAAILGLVGAAAVRGGLWRPGDMLTLALVGTPSLALALALVDRLEASLDRPAQDPCGGESSDAT